jgi:hypothetical protein
MTKEPDSIALPPPELRAKWRSEAPRNRDAGISREDYLMDRAAEWGADEELETTLAEVFFLGGLALTDRVRAARRPKPLSLKEQALERCNDYIDPDGIIRRALEALPND